jgi:tripartite-type tricarboxylate transporter receptor subunit TctC
MAQDDFPNRPIRIVVPVAPGAATDAIARILADQLRVKSGQSVIVENRAGGASGNVGAEYVARSAPDGYTLMFSAAGPIALNKLIYAKMTFDPAVFVPVSLVASISNVLIVRSESPYKSVRDIINYAKANPGKLNYGTGGLGTTVHITTEKFKAQSGSDILHVPYKGAGPALTDVIGGQVDVMFATASAVGSLVDGGKLRARAVTTPARSPSPQLSMLPTVAESGVPGYSAGSWYGYFAPAGTPPDVINKLNASIKKASQSPTFKARVEGEGLVVRAGSPEEFGKFVKAEELRWRTVIKDANISPD